MRDVLCLMASGIVLCASVATAESYEERIKAGRQRLAEVARQEAEANPDDAEAYFRAHLLDPSWTPKGGAPRSPLLAEQESWRVVSRARYRRTAPETVQEAREVVDGLEAIAPIAAWVPIDRLLLLCADGAESPGLWRRAAELLEEAARRKNDLEDRRRFWVRFQDWAAEREEDPLVRLDATLGPVFWDARGMFLRTSLARWAYGAALARGPADPDLVRLLDAFDQYADRRLRETTDAAEFLTCQVLLQKVLEARGLIAFRARDDEGLSRLCDRLDELLRIGEARGRHAHELYESHRELWAGIANTEVSKALDGVLDTEKWKEKSTGEVLAELVEAAQRYNEDPTMREELLRATARVADAIMKLRHEELAHVEPLVRQDAAFARETVDGFNCLRRLQDDAPSLRAGRLPEARMDDLLDRALANAFPETEHGRVYGYGAWLLAMRDALLVKGAAPVESIRARLSSPSGRMAPILVTLRAQGEEVGAEELDAALQEVLEKGTELDFDAWCIVLGERAKAEPSAALAMLPEEGMFLLDECEAMIAQALRNALGEDHGVVLAGWRERLAREK